MEQEWLDEKFRQSGNPSPAPGEISVVIEYCYNVGVPEADNAKPRSQMTTSHDKKRYQEEAELVRAFLSEYYPGIAVAVLAIDFQNRETSNLRRLGAFEVDARLMIDGEIAEFNLWSKLHTKLWPVWPDWQEMVKLRLPIFSLVLRPVMLLADGSVVHVSGTELTLSSASLSGERTLRKAPVPPHDGLPVRLLRGVYTISISETGACYAERTVLDLSSIAPPSFSGAHELAVPLFAKPKLSIQLDLPRAPADAGVEGSGAGASAAAAVSLGLPHCAARLSDVTVVIKERGSGLELFSLPVKNGQPIEVDLTPFKERIVLPRTSLADRLRAMFESADGGADYPLGSSHNGFGAAEATGAATAVSFAGSEPAGWGLEVEAVLRSFPDVALDPARCRVKVTVTKGGAPPLRLQLVRLSREVVVRVASPEHFTDKWSSGLPLPALRVEVRHATTRGHVASLTATPVGATDPSAPPGSLAAALLLHEAVTYHVSVGATATTRPASETVQVHEGTREVVLMVERASGSLSVTWGAAPLAESHWAKRLPMVLPLNYEVFHQPTGAKVLSGTVEAPGGSGVRPVGGKGYSRVDELTSVISADELLAGEAYILRIPEGGGMQPNSLSFTLSSASDANVARLSLSRATSSLAVSLSNRGGAEPDAGGRLWADALPLPRGITFSVRHVATGALVAEAHADASGRGFVAGADALFVGEEYELSVAESTSVRAAKKLFSCAPGGTEVSLAVERVGVPISAQLAWSLADESHWAAKLAAPAGVAVRAVHRASGSVVAEATTDSAGRVQLPPAGLYAGETYSLEVVPSAHCRAASVEFKVNSSGAQAVPLAIERQTADVTIALRLRSRPGVGANALNAAAAAPSIPKGMRYSVSHAGLGVEVAAGVTDAVGKAVVKRKGTLFVGESYEIEVSFGLCTIL